MSRNPFDRVTEKFTRRLAGQTSRRSVLAKLGLFAAGGAAFPLLPVARASAQTASLTEFERNAQTSNDRACNYWRYCAIDGALCTCCGGGVHTCPAGSQPSPTSWVGTCRHPETGKTFLISYRDCCGKGPCGQCMCDNQDRETPVYRPQGNNDVLWCFGLPTMAYHCSTAVLIGEA